MERWGQPRVVRGGTRRIPELAPAGFGLAPEEMPRPATSASVFGNDRPLEIEIGAGKGTFLATESKLRPEVNFIGLEYASRYWRLAADRMRRNACSNVRIVLSEACDFLHDFISDGALSAVHIYFPDPWPKRRHRKRRLIQPPFVALLAAKLRPGGRVQLVTDFEDYFVQMRRVLEESPLECMPFGTPLSAAPDEVVGTNFERKYRKEGRHFFRIAARRV